MPGPDGGGDGGPPTGDGPLAFTPTFVETPCLTSPPRPSRCGFVTVPESWTDPVTPGQRTVKLAVAIYASKSAAPATDAVVYLDGGPGGDGISFVGMTVASDGPLSPLLATRDLIVISQRGTGASQPSLDCRELTEPPPGGMMMSADDPFLDAVKRCHERLVKEGVPLSNYTSAQAADDVEGVRRALARAPWNVFGGSYGTRLALEVLRRHSSGVRAVILDSVMGPDTDWLAEWPREYLPELNAVFAGCDAQPDCAGAYPNLEKVFRDLIVSLNVMPALDGRLNGSAFLQAISEWQGYEQTAGYIPEIIYLGSEGDFSVFTGGAAFRTSAPQETEFSWGLHMSVVCTDMFPLTSLAKVKQVIADLNDPVLGPILEERATAYFSLCGIWNVLPSPADSRTPVTSDKPVLLLAGLIDTATPPNWARQVARTLSAGQLLELKGVGHGTMLNPCVASMFNTFLDKPTEKLSPICLAGLTDVEYLVLR